MKAAIKNENNNAHQSDDVNDITEAFSLIICIKPEDDFPHPRHLCFKYPFGKTSHKRHCIKCYCYVCEEVAPCKKWSKPSHKHCQATEKDECWRLQRKLRKKHPGTTLTMAHHKLSVSVVFDPPGQFTQAFAGGLICNANGDWISGLSMRIVNIIFDLDCLFSLYTVLLEGLKLSWTQGLRHVDVLLGFMYHDGFWHDFKKNDRTRKFELSVDAYSVSIPWLWAVMKDVEDYLNREWFIDVVNFRSLKEESGAYSLAVMTEYQAEENKVFDFTPNPLITAQIKSFARETISNVLMHYEKFVRIAWNDDEMKYFGFN